MLEVRELGGISREGRRLVGRPECGHGLCLWADSLRFLAGFPRGLAQPKPGHDSEALLID